MCEPAVVAVALSTTIAGAATESTTDSIRTPEVSSVGLAAVPMSMTWPS
jgi:hypothetical protein